jgi:pantothenate kinase
MHRPIDELVLRARQLTRNDRAILGIAGLPGSGKSTLATFLLGRLSADGESVAHVPMDGFHLSDAALEGMGRKARKGAIDTFDAYSYLALLRRLRAERDHTVYAPDFERTLEQPIANSIPVEPTVRLVVTEGNYLLAEAAPWPEIRAEMTEVWFVEFDEDRRREQLVARHIEFGKSPEVARRWVDEVDEANARLIRLGRGSADLIVDLSKLRVGDDAGGTRTD